MLPKPDINFQRTPVTLILAAVAVALELACTFDDAQDGGRRLAYYHDSLGILPSIWAGELWRPFTTTLLHGGLLHAAFNCYWLVIFGSALENRFGPFRTLGLIVLLGYVSTLPQFIVSNYNTGPKEQIAVVGLSGVVYGLFGILLVAFFLWAGFDAVRSATTVPFDSSSAGSCCASSSHTSVGCPWQTLPMVPGWPSAFSTAWPFSTAGAGSAGRRWRPWLRCWFCAP